MGDRVPIQQADESAHFDAAGVLLHDFNVEFGDPAPEPSALAARLKVLVDGGDTIVLLAGPAPLAVAVLRFRGAIWSDSLECYLAELYVVPEHRGRGVGRALMNAVLDVARARGATTMEIGVDEPDLPARALYESLGFRNTTGSEGHVMHFYEREL